MTSTNPATLRNYRSIRKGKDCYVTCNYTNVDFKGEYLISFRGINGWHTCLIKSKDLIRKHVGLAKILLLEPPQKDRALIEINMCDIHENKYQKKAFYVPKHNIVMEI